MTPTYRHWTPYKKNIPLSRLMRAPSGRSGANILTRPTASSSARPLRYSAGLSEIPTLRSSMRDSVHISTISLLMSFRTPAGCSGTISGRSCPRRACRAAMTTLIIGDAKQSIYRFRQRRSVAYHGDGSRAVFLTAWTRTWIPMSKIPTGVHRCVWWSSTTPSSVFSPTGSTGVVRPGA